jgi:hypothetical protein
MRDRREIEREMYRAREDLEAKLGELKHVVEEKVDVRARASHAVHERVDAVKDRARTIANRAVDGGKHAYYRGRDGAVDLYYKGRYGAGRAYDRSRDVVKERPVLVAAVLGGVLLATVGAILLIRRHNRRFI